jgi:hypothetical protein
MRDMGITRLHNKKVIFVVIVIVIALFLLGLIGKSNNEEKRMIDNSIKAIEARDYGYAREALGSVVDGNNKKVDKLWNIISCYYNASQAIADYNIDKAKEYLNKMNSSYKDYPTLKEDVELIKRDIAELEEYRKDYDEKIENIEESINKENYKDALSSAESIIGSSKASKEQREKVDKLRSEAFTKLGELRKMEDKKQLESELNELKSQDEKFTVEMAKEFAEKNNSINTGNTRFEVISDSQYDPKGRRYYKVEVYLKDNNELINNYAIYADGRYELLQNVEADN